MATLEEINGLKMSWLHDPCWDLAETLGYEEHREELAEYQRLWEERWRVERESELEKFAKRLCTNNLDLAEYIQQLEKRIDELESRL